MTGPMPLRAWGSEDDEEDYYRCDPHRHCTPDVECVHDKADADWSRTLAALDGVAGDSIYERMWLEEQAYWGDWREPDA